MENLPLFIGFYKFPGGAGFLPSTVLGNLYIHDDQNRQRTQLVNGSKGISLAFQVGVLHNSIQKWVPTSCKWNSYHKPI